MNILKACLNIFLAISSIVLLFQPNGVISAKDNSAISPEQSATGKLQLTESDPWYFERLGVRDAWAALDAAGRPHYSLRVAVIDTGVQRDHPDLRGAIADEGYDATTGNDRTKDPKAGEPKGTSWDFYHGTAVAGMIAAVPGNGEGIMGVGGNFLQILPINIFDSQFKTKSAYTASAIDWAIAHNAAVINISQGGYGLSDDEISPAIERAIRAGRIIVASSGNDSRMEINYPANQDKVIAVGGTDKDDIRNHSKSIFCGLRDYEQNNDSCGSNFGTELDLVAPGSSLTTLVLSRKEENGTYNTYSKPEGMAGTSFSAPIVAATAGLMRLANSSISQYQVQDLLQRTADKVHADMYDYSSRGNEGGWNIYMGFGRVNVGNAVRAVLDPSAPTVSLHLTPDRLPAGNQSTNVSIAVFNKFLEPGGYYPLRYTRTVQTDANGYTASFQIPFTLDGSYILCAKPYHYTFNCRSVSLTRGKNTFVDYPALGVAFYPGDFFGGSGPGNGEDGIINAKDLEIFRDRYWGCTGSAGVGVPACMEIDWNRDGIVNNAEFLAEAWNYHNHANSNPLGNEGQYYKEWRPFATTPIANTLSAAVIDPQASGGSAWITLYNYQGAPMVGDHYGVNVYLDLTTMNVGAGSSTLIIHYDPGVWDVEDQNVNKVGIQVQAYPNVFTDIGEGEVDPTKGEIIINGMVPSGATGGTKTQGLIATLPMIAKAGISNTEIWAEWQSSDSFSSDISEYRSSAAVTVYANNFQTGIDGVQRVVPTVSINLPTGQYLSIDNAPISVNASDPFNQIQKVELDVMHDGTWTEVGTDTVGEDGWNFTFDSKGIVDQRIQFRALAFLPGIAYGQANTSTIILDRTAPEFREMHLFFNHDSWNYPVNSFVYAYDSLSGMKEIQFYVNTATDGSDSGEWILKGKLENIDYDSLIWTTDGLFPGKHRVVLAMEDQAGNWNRWTDPSLPIFTFGDQKSFIYLPLVRNGGSYTEPPTPIYQTSTFYGKSVELGNENCAVWLTCHSSLAGTLYFDRYPLGTIAAVKSGSAYTIKRIFIDFDTTTLPPNAIIDQVKLNFYAGTSQSGNTKVHLVQTEMSIPPAGPSDFGKVLFLSGGSSVPQKDAWSTIHLSPNSLKWIHSGSQTVLALIAEADLYNIVPGEDSILIFMDESENPPSLEVTYHLPS